MIVRLGRFGIMPIIPPSTAAAFAPPQAAALIPGNGAGLKRTVMIPNSSNLPPTNPSSPPPSSPPPSQPGMKLNVTINKNLNTTGNNVSAIVNSKTVAAAIATKVQQMNAQFNPPKAIGDSIIKRLASLWGTLATAAPSTLTTSTSDGADYVGTVTLADGSAQGNNTGTFPGGFTITVKHYMYANTLDGVMSQMLQNGVENFNPLSSTQAPTTANSVSIMNSTEASPTSPNWLIEVTSNNPALQNPGQLGAIMLAATQVVNNPNFQGAAFNPPTNGDAIVNAVAALYPGSVPVLSNMTSEGSTTSATLDYAGQVQIPSTEFDTDVTTGDAATDGSDEAIVNASDYNDPTGAPQTGLVIYLNHYSSDVPAIPTATAPPPAPPTSTTPPTKAVQSEGAAAVSGATAQQQVLLNSVLSGGFAGFRGFSFGRFFAGATPAPNVFNVGNWQVTITPGNISSAALQQITTAVTQAINSVPAGSASGSNPNCPYGSAPNGYCYPAPPPPPSACQFGTDASGNCLPAPLPGTAVPSSSTNWLLIGGVLAAAAAGLYLYSKESAS